MNKINELFGIDLRSLALFRVCLGLLILFDLTTRLPDLNTFYTDAGLLPRESLFNHMPSPWALSIHFMSGTILVQAILFFIQGVCAVGLLFGYRTRWMAVLSWFLMASLHRRNHMVIGGGDDYFRLLLFWSMFLPMGARFSIDNILKSSNEKLPARTLSWGTVAILLQIVVGYLMAGYHKWNLPVWHDGTAVYYALNVDNYAKNFAQTLLLFPSLWKFLTHATLWFELLGPFLLFCPIFLGPVRTLTVFGFLFMHLGFYLTMYLMLFPWVSAVAMLVFLPSWFWDQFLVGLRNGFSAPIKRLKALRQRPSFIQFETMWRERLSQLPAGSTKIKPSKLENVFALLFLICVLLWNLQTLNPLRYTMPEAFQFLCQLTHLDQEWRMFAPPVGTGGWFVVPGKLKDGTEVDLFRQGKPVNWTKPPEHARFPNERWRRYMFNFTFGKNKIFWTDYARYLCHSWNVDHPDQQQLESLEIIFMSRKTPPPGQQAEEYKEKILLQYSCSVSPRQVPSQEKQTSASNIIPSQGTRPPACAGTFYPANADTLRQTVDRFIANANSNPLPGELVAMLIPHASYKYSGTVLGDGYKQIGTDWTTVILLGPSHHIPIEGAAVWARGSFATPLGEVAVDETLAQKLLDSSSLFHDSSQPHKKEHSLEVELPFLQRSLGNFKIVPILISTTDLKICRQLGETIAQAVKGQKVLILISSDLSHYPDRDSARRIDSTTMEAMKLMKPELMERTSGLLMKRTDGSVLKTTMCGQGALFTGMYAALRLGANQALSLGYTNSGTSENGDLSRVVGYGAVAFLKGSPNADHQQQMNLDAKTQDLLLTLASESIREGLEGTPLKLVPLSENPVLNLPTSVFVTLEINGRLRGCRGSTFSSQSLLDAVAFFAREAAFHDPRFAPLTKEEFRNVRIKISVLSPRKRIAGPDQIIPGKHGVIVHNAKHSGVFLPDVWEKFPGKEKFLTELCVQKAHLPSQCWKDPQTTFNVFTTTEFGD